MLLIEECASANSRDVVCSQASDGAGQSCHKYFPILPRRMCCKLMSNRERGSRGEGERALKQINVIAFSNCGGGGGFVRVVWFYDVHLSVGGWKLSRQMTPHWPSKDFLQLFLRKLYLPVITAAPCVSPPSECVTESGQTHGSTHLTCMLFVLEKYKNTLCLLCRYDICIQKNKPCETLGNKHTHTHTNTFNNKETFLSFYH